MTDQVSSDRDLGRLEGKVDGLSARFDTRFDDLIARLDKRDKRDDDVELRLRAVERRQYWMAGAVAVVSFILAKIDLTQVLAIIHQVTS